MVFLTSLAARFALSRASLVFARLARDSSRFSRALAAASSSPVFRSKRFTLLTRTFAGRPERFVEDRFVIAADRAPDVVAAPRPRSWAVWPNREAFQMAERRRSEDVDLDQRTTG